MVVGVAPSAVLLDSNTVYFETDAAVVMVTGAVVLMSSTASPSVAMKDRVSIRRKAGGC